MFIKLRIIFIISCETLCLGLSFKSMEAHWDSVSTACFTDKLLLSFGRNRRETLSGFKILRITPSRNC